MVIGKGRFYDPKEGILPAVRLKNQQDSLREIISHFYSHAPFVRRLLDRAGVRPFEVRTIADLESIPVTRKNDVIEAQKNDPPFGGLLAAPADEIERVFISPGPIYEIQSSDINWFASSFYAAGFRKGDIVINTFTYHMSPAGLMFHDGLRQCGASVVVMGAGNTDNAIKTMLNLKVNGFAGTPSYLMAIIRKAEEMGYNFSQDFALAKAWFTGEMLPPSTRKILEEDYKISTSQAYAVTEPGGAIAYECQEHNGMHLMGDYIVEIVDPDTGRQLKPGEVGEIVVTPVHNRMWGLIRFGTGDLSSLITTACPCGRTTPRLSGLLGRSADAVKVRGMFVVAKQAEEVLDSFDEIRKYQIVVGRKGERDEMALRVELKDNTTNQSLLLSRINQKFKAVCRLSIDDVIVVPADTLTEDRGTINDTRKWE